MLEHGGSETAAIAALLHDVVEDGGGERALAEIGERFGPEVAAIVEGCSDTTADARRTGRCASTATSRISRSRSPDVLLVSGADKLHNARSILADLREHGDELWDALQPRRRASSSGTTARCATSSCAACRAGWPTSSTATVREIERRIDPEDRVAWLGLPCEFWSTDGGESGAFIDLRDACRRVAMLAPLVAEELREAGHLTRPSWATKSAWNTDHGGDAVIMRADVETIGDTRGL